MEENDYEMVTVNDSVFTLTVAVNAGDDVVEIQAVDGEDRATVRMTVAETIATIAALSAAIAVASRNHVTG